MPKTDVHHTSTPTGGLWGPLKLGCSLPLPRALTLCRQAGIYYTETIVWVHGSCFWGDCARVRPGFLFKVYAAICHLKAHVGLALGFRVQPKRDVQVLICLSVIQKFHPLTQGRSSGATRAVQPSAILRQAGGEMVWETSVLSLPGPKHTHRLV